jgi:hypothetical protein
MARVTKNRLVEDLGNGSKRASKFNGPATESENARFYQGESFRQDSVASGQSAVALTLGGIDTHAPTSFVAGRAGVIAGVAWSLSTASTHTAGSVQVTVGGTAKGDVVKIDGGGTAAVVDQSVDVAFNEGDLIGVAVTTDGSWTPTPHLNVWPLIRWTA